MYRSVKMIVTLLCVIVFALSSTRGVAHFVRNCLCYFRLFLRMRICVSISTISPDLHPTFISSHLIIHAFIPRSFSVRAKMVYSTYKKQRILYLYSQSYRPPTIKEMLDKKNLKCSRVCIFKFLESYRTHVLLGAFRV